MVLVAHSSGLRSARSHIRHAPSEDVAVAVQSRPAPPTLDHLAPPPPTDPPTHLLWGPVEPKIQGTAGPLVSAIVSAGQLGDDEGRVQCSWVFIMTTGM